jgi:hypothetical protein
MTLDSLSPFYAALMHIQYARRHISLDLLLEELVQQCGA